MNRLLDKYGYMIDTISDERSCNDGYFIYLKDGFICEGCQTIHEYTIKECEHMLKHYVEKIKGE